MKDLGHRIRNLLGDPMGGAAPIPGQSRHEGKTGAAELHQISRRIGSRDEHGGEQLERMLKLMD